ncbi:MAG: hypothetical protein LPK38_01750 [Actinomycetes bacterium]|nr:hypothetical protein [Actinomycetes bacterium]MDX5449743.1 hypothetical protein [Actinomycetes bacterium]
MRDATLEALADLYGDHAVEAQAAASDAAYAGDEQAARDAETMARTWRAAAAMARRVADGLPAEEPTGYAHGYRGTPCD